jgi:predicted nucleotidyltransferase
VFRLDRERILSLLAERARSLLAQRPEVIEIRLFGSLARGDATPGSDADLWILVRDGAGPFVERSAGLARCFEGVGIGCEAIAYAESEWRRMRDEGRRIVRVVSEEGAVLAKRTGPAARS